MTLIPIIVLAAPPIYFALRALLDRVSGEDLSILVCLAAFSLIVYLRYLTGLSIAPQPNRYIPELTTFLSVAAARAVDALVKPNARRVAYSAIALAVSLLCMLEVEPAHALAKPIQDIKAAPEYKIAEWLDSNAREMRVYATGTPCFWLNVFSDIPQVRGGYDSAAINSWWDDVTYLVNSCRNPELALMWLKAMGVSYMVVIYPNASTAYHDYKNPEVYSQLKLAYKTGGFAIYKLPSQPIIQPVDADAVRVRIKSIRDKPALTTYLKAVSSQPTAPCNWSYTKEGIEVSVSGASKEVGILVKMTYDRRWVAEVNGRRVKVERVGPDFMLIYPALPGSYKLKLKFEKTLLEKLLAIVSVATLLGMPALAWRSKT